MADWIRTLSKTKVSFTNPDPRSIYISDIATALSRTCRFASQTPRFYSVAEHSIYVAAWVGWPAAIYGLLHDAHEAYTGDIPQPLKRLLGPEILKIEERIQGAIYERYLIPPPDQRDLEVVAAADSRMLITELDQVMGDPVDRNDLQRYTALPIRIMFLDPGGARQVFEQRFYSYIQGVSLIENMNMWEDMWEATK